MRTRATTTLAAVLLLAALTACSSSDSDDASTTPTAEPTADASSSAPADTSGGTSGSSSTLEQAVQAYTVAYFKGDADTAYAALSKRCQGKISAAEYGGVVEQAKTDYGPGHSATDVKAEVSGKLARVTYKVTGLPKFDQDAQPWALEGGTWKYDAC